jgi:hypothetical protein
MAMLPVLLSIACRSAPWERGASSLYIRLSADSSVVSIEGLPHDAIQFLLEDADSAAWISLFPVYRESKNPRMYGLEPVYPGTYRIAGDMVLYIPDSGFVKGNTYRAEINLPAYYPLPETAVKERMPGWPERRMQTFRFE